MQRRANERKTGKLETPSLGDMAVTVAAAAWEASCTKVSEA